MLLVVAGHLSQPNQVAQASSSWITEWLWAAAQIRLDSHALHCLAASLLLLYYGSCQSVWVASASTWLLGATGDVTSSVRHLGHGLQKGAVHMRTIPCSPLQQLATVDATLSALSVQEQSYTLFAFCKLNTPIRQSHTHTPNKKKNIRCTSICPD